MYKITSNFHQQEAFRNIPHNGIDFAMPTGTELKSIKDGIVTKVCDLGNQNAGKYIKVKWEDGKEAIYGHLSEFKVTEGQIVHSGDTIGYSGNSGFTTGAHLHFGLKENGAFIDPTAYINDIQHMNDPGYLVQQVVTNKTTLFDMMSQYSDMLNEIAKNFKIQFIDIFISFDYTPFIKLLQYAIQLIFFYS